MEFLTLQGNKWRYRHATNTKRAESLLNHQSVSITINLNNKIIPNLNECFMINESNKAINTNAGYYVWVEKELCVGGLRSPSAFLLHSASQTSHCFHLLLINIVLSSPIPRCICLHKNAKLSCAFVAECRGWWENIIFKAAFWQMAAL